MVIYNKTSQVQELGVHDRSTQRSYSIYVNSHSSTTLDAYTTAPNLKKLVAAGIFQILEDYPVKSTYEECKNDCDHRCGDQECNGHCEETTDVEDSETNEDEKELDTENENSEDTEEESTEETPEGSEESKFICNICNGEFASARGLSRHMNSAHANEA